MTKLLNIISIINELEEDQNMPKNVKQGLATVVQILKENNEASIKISRALHELESLIEDTSLQQFSRGQLLNVVSMLESANS